MSSQTLFFIFKAILSGLLIAGISTLAKHTPRWAALLTALPLMTYLSLIWIYVETKDLALLESYTRDVTLWLIPGLAFFIAAIFLFRARVAFGWSMVLATASLFAAVWAVKKMGILA